MGCAEFKKLWTKYEKGTLTHDEQEQLESHIETCAECGAHLDELLAKSEPVKKNYRQKILKFLFGELSGNIGYKRLVLYYPFASLYI